MKLEILKNKDAETATQTTTMNVAPYNTELNHPQVLLAKLTNKQEYINSIRGHLDFYINNQQKTPKGLLFFDIWGSLRHAANAALLMLQVSTQLCCQYLHTLSLSYGVSQENGLN
jgi:hypothetical protein